MKPKLFVVLIVFCCGAFSARADSLENNTSPEKMVVARIVSGLLSDKSHKVGGGRACLALFKRLAAGEFNEVQAKRPHSPERGLIDSICQGADPLKAVQRTSCDLILPGPYWVGNLGKNTSFYISENSVCLRDVEGFSSADGNKKRDFSLGGEIHLVDKRLCRDVGWSPFNKNSSPYENQFTGDVLIDDKLFGNFILRLSKLSGLSSAYHIKDQSIDRSSFCRIVQK